MTLKLKDLYDLLLDHHGYQHWWPVDSEYHKKNNSDPRFEIIIGAILTQNTAWTNVEKALSLLKKHNYFTIQRIANIDQSGLKNLIRSSGFFNQKAHRLKNLAIYLENQYNGDLSLFFNRDFSVIRHELLSLNGIGPETADSILLYAGGFPVFVVDAYTKRLCSRLPILAEGKTYGDIQQYFESELKKYFTQNDIIPVHKQFHALIVELAKTFCKKKPVCASCPLNNHCSLFQQSL